MLQKLGRWIISLMGALYHDVGKMTNPQFLSKTNMRVRIRTSSAPKASAQKIIEHVVQGISIAKSLPLALQRFITAHHGDSRVEYFIKNPCKTTKKP